MNIVLLGYRGTGKSAVARLLSRRLKRPLFSIDAMVVRKAGRSIPDIVREWGWPKFREMESDMVRHVVSQARDAIIDCGGGVVLDDTNVECLKQDGKAVLFTASLETLLQRIGRDQNRPPLKEGLSFEEEQKKVLSERQEKYQAAADFVVDTTHKRPGETAREIIQHFRKQKWI